MLNFYYQIQNNSEKNFDHKYNWKKYTQNVTEKISPLYVSILNENIEIFQLLLSKANIDVNFGYTKDQCCQKWRNIQTLKKSSLFAAIESENIEILNLLSNHDINLDLGYIYKEECHRYNNYIIEENKNPLYVSIENDFIEAVRISLSQNKTNVNYINKIIILVSPDELYDEEENDKNGNKDDDDLYPIESFKSYDDFFEGKEEDEFDENEKIALLFAIEKENIEILTLLLSDENLNINMLHFWINHYFQLFKN